MRCCCCQIRVVYSSLDLILIRFVRLDSFRSRFAIARSIIRSLDRFAFVTFYPVGLDLVRRFEGDFDYCTPVVHAINFLDHGGPAVRFCDPSCADCSTIGGIDRHAHKRDNTNSYIARAVMLA